MYLFLFLLNKMFAAVSEKYIPKIRFLRRKNVEMLNKIKFKVRFLEVRLEDWPQSQNNEVLELIPMSIKYSFWTDPSEYQN